MNGPGGERCGVNVPGNERSWGELYMVGGGWGGGGRWGGGLDERYRVPGGGGGGGGGVLMNSIRSGKRGGGLS